MGKVGEAIENVVKYGSKCIYCEESIGKVRVE